MWAWCGTPCVDFAQLVHADLSSKGILFCSPKDMFQVLVTGVEKDLFLERS